MGVTENVTLNTLQLPVLVWTEFVEGEQPPEAARSGNNEKFAVVTATTPMQRTIPAIPPDLERDYAVDDQGIPLLFQSNFSPFQSVLLPFTPIFFTFFPDRSFATFKFKVC